MAHIWLISDNPPKTYDFKGHEAILNWDLHHQNQLCSQPIVDWNFQFHYFFVEWQSNLVFKSNIKGVCNQGLTFAIVVKSTKNLHCLTDAAFGCRIYESVKLVYTIFWPYKKIIWILLYQIKPFIIIRFVIGTVLSWASAFRCWWYCWPGIIGPWIRIRSGVRCHLSHWLRIAVQYFVNLAVHVHHHVLKYDL